MKLKFIFLRVLFVELSGSAYLCYFVVKFKVQIKTCQHGMVGPSE